MSAPNVCILSDRSQDQLQKWRSQLTELASEKHPDGQDYQDAAAIAQTVLSRPCLGAITEVVQNPSAMPVLLRGIPVADDDACFADSINNLFLVGILASAGLEVFSYSEQNSGQIVQDIIPIPGKEHTN